MEPLKSRGYQTLSLIGTGKDLCSVCTLPWWNDLLLAGRSRTTTEATLRINQRRVQLAETLNRPSMLDNSLAHECYYSVSTEGSFLPRHMDERHEELKGAKGWLLPSAAITILAQLSERSRLGSVGEWWNFADVSAINI